MRFTCPSWTGFVLFVSVWSIVHGEYPPFTGMELRALGVLAGGVLESKAMTMLSNENLACFMVCVPEKEKNRERTPGLTLLQLMRLTKKMLVTALGWSTGEARRISPLRS